MSLYVLDTDMVSLFQHGHPQVCMAVSRHSPADVAITVITGEEQLSGWYKELRRAKKPQTLAAMYQRMADTVRSYSSMLIHSLTEQAIQRYESLKRQRLNVRKTDLRIAAITLDLGAVLVTRNRRDFERVPKLPIEDWSK